MSAKQNPRWRAGWLQWGSNINGITPSAEKELQELKTKHPDWDFNDLANKVRVSAISAILQTNE